MKIKVYTYCSYKFSPVGFKHGAFQLDTENSNDEYVVPSSNSTPPIVCTCFVQSLIKGAKGKIPDTDEYIILLKGLECDFVNEDGEPSKKYGNFAFSTDEIESYNNLINVDLNELSKAMNSFLIPDSKAGEAAIKIDTKQFIDFIENVSNKSDSTENPNYLTIRSSSSGDKVIKTLKEEFPEYSVEPESVEPESVEPESKECHYLLKKKALNPQKFPMVQYLKSPIMAIPIIIALIAAVLLILRVK